MIVESEEFYEDDDGSPGSTIKSLKARKAELHQQVERQARGKHSLQVCMYCRHDWSTEIRSGDAPAIETPLPSFSLFGGLCGFLG